MAAWTLVPCLERLRADVDEIAPDRDKSTDGTIGDEAHQEHISDHNDDEVGKVPIRDADSKHEVHAIDLDVDLRTPGVTMEDVVQHVLSRCRSGAEKRLRYVIFNRRIWEASTGWRERAYSGANAHTQHAHFSASYDTVHEASTASWHLEELMPLSDADVERIADAVWQRKLYSGHTALTIMATLFKRTGNTENVRLPAIQQALSGLVQRFKS